MADVETRIMVISDEQVGAWVDWHLARNIAHGIDPESLDLGAKFLQAALAPKA